MCIAPISDFAYSVKYVSVTASIHKVINSPPPQGYEEKEKDLNGNKDSAAKLQISRGFNGADLSSLFRGGVGQEGGYPFPIKREEEEAEAERRNGE